MMVWGMSSFQNTLLYLECFCDTFDCIFQTYGWRIFVSILDILFYDLETKFNCSESQNENCLHFPLNGLGS